MEGDGVRDFFTMNPNLKQFFGEGGGAVGLE